MKHFIRLAKQEEAAILSAMHRLCLPPGWSPEEFKVFLADSLCLALIAEVENQPAGMILSRITADEAEILTFAVLPDFRRKGLGAALLKSLVGKLHETRAKTLFLEVSEANHPAIALYQSQGGKLLGIRKSYYADGSHALNMAIPLT